MANFHFIEDDTTLSIINAILNLAGPNFNAPYDSDAQPSSGVARNDEGLLQYQLPGGSQLKGFAEPAVSQDMGSAINSLLSVLAPFISAYGLVLPIIGVIRGLIEIMCAMMNPFAVIAAVIRLFVKWIPPFIALFPPFAGVIIILSTIKTILAIVFFIQVELIPTLELIVENIRTLVDAFGPNGNDQQVKAGREKLTRLLLDFLNRIGIIGTLLPLLEIIFLILGLVAGFPCNSGKRSDCSRGSLSRGGDEDFPCDDVSDTSNRCPEVLKNPPEGRALILPSFFGDSIPFFAFRIITLTGNDNLSEIRPFLQDFQTQLGSQLDEPVDEASPFGGDGSSAHFTLEITDKRGNVIKSPIARVSGNVIITINPALFNKVGIVDYKIIPNFPLLIGRNIIGVGCHPDVETVIDQLQARLGNTELSAIDKNPESANLLGNVRDLNNDLNESLQQIQGVINEVNQNPPDPDLQFNPQIERIQNEQTVMLDRLNSFSNSLISDLNAILTRSTDRVASELEVNKNIVKAGGENFALIIVTPRDFTGAPLARNLPSGVDINVDIFSDFGTISNKKRNNNTGQITAELRSPFPGTANITAKVNSEFISTFDGGNENRKTINVRFVADSVLPKRRKVSKVGQKNKSNTGRSSERSPGGK